MEECEAAPVRWIDAATEMLMAQLDKSPRTKPLVRLIEPQLIIRASSGPARRR